MKHVRLSVTLSVLLLLAHNAAAACVNRFLVRTERPRMRQTVTLLTGKLTFAEAQALAAAIEKKEAPPVQWVREDGRLMAAQVGEMKVVRPMPVGCDGKSSGVVVVVTFAAAATPSKKMFVKLDGETIVAFDEQAN